ncbi:MAG: hypothetical protein U1D30_08305 [Planctomycetota bacterium]
MPDARIDVKNLDLREVFPWVHLFRGFRIALDPKKILLGALGAFLMSAGWWLVARMVQEETLPESPPVVEGKADSATDEEIEEYRLRALRFAALEDARRFPWQAPPNGSPDVFRSPFAEPGNVGELSSLFLILEPLKRLVFPVKLMFQSTSATIVGMALTAWTLLVWALFGGAITRIAAVQIAREGQVGFFDAIRFVLGRYMSYVGAPILPFLGVVIVVALCLLGGLLTWIPFLDVLMGVLWILPLLAGLIMALALLGLALGWPLMYSAISTEATESFDSLSRSYSYVLERPWHYLFYAIVALVYGGVLTTLAVTVGYLVIDLSQYAVSWGGGSVNLQMLYSYVPVAGGWRADFGPAAGMSEPTGTTYVTAILVGIWTHVVFLAIVGFTYSYFWSAATIIYFLLRQDVDETEFEEVFLDEVEEEPFPTVNPTLSSVSAAPPPAKGSGGFSLPIIDPPK